MHTFAYSNMPVHTLPLMIFAKRGKFQRMALPNGVIKGKIKLDSRKKIILESGGIKLSVGILKNQNLSYFYHSGKGSKSSDRLANGPGKDPTWNCCLLMSL